MEFSCSLCVVSRNEVTNAIKDTHTSSCARYANVQQLFCLLISSPTYVHNHALTTMLEHKLSMGLQARKSPATIAK